MILFWGALAVGFLVAFVLWAQGQWSASGRDPYKIIGLVWALFWFGLTMGLAQKYWSRLGDVLSMIESGRPILARYADQARDDRSMLVMCLLLSFLSGRAVLNRVAETTAAFKHRKARTKAQPEETHA